jgi:hypothetical protein
MKGILELIISLPEVIIQPNHFIRRMPGSPAARSRRETFPWNIPEDLCESSQ